MFDDIGRVSDIRDGPGWDSEVSFSNWAEPRAKVGAFKGHLLLQESPFQSPQKKCREGSITTSLVGVYSSIFVGVDVYSWMIQSMRSHESTD